MADSDVVKRKTLLIVVGALSMVLLSLLLVWRLGVRVGNARKAQIMVDVTPAASGRQLLRFSLPLAKGLLLPGHMLVASDGKQQMTPGLRVLTWHPAGDPGGRSARRALVTLPYMFKGTERIRLTFRPAPMGMATKHPWPVDVRMDGETVAISYDSGLVLHARLLAPRRESAEEARTEDVESNALFLWRRTRLPDAVWPRVVELRVDALGCVVVVAHLQRSEEGDAYAPEFGWEIDIRTSECRLEPADQGDSSTQKESVHAFVDGTSCTCFLEGDRYRLYHPTAAFKRRGRVEVTREGADRIRYRYLRCTPEEKVPMQQAAWRRAEFVVAPAELAPLTAALECPHKAQVDWQLWDELYRTGPPLDLKDQPSLDAALRNHHDAIVGCVCEGDDWGNVTGYRDDSRTGSVFGMNRLNHCPPIFAEAYRSGDQRLLEAALLWCDNFYDQSIWWGPGGTGGTRYNNGVTTGGTPPDDGRFYMWRSSNAVNFCTKGYDSFFLAYEQTGDPRMMEALDAQVRYAAEHVRADQGECRNIGDVRDFVRLFEFTGEERYLHEALRLFREVRTKLSAGNLFSPSGRSIIPDSPFIDDDQAGQNSPFPKPYIIGYGLAGLPALATHAPDELELRDVIQAVADFLAQSQDPLGGWRYPHPRSSSLILSQAMEHAWQLVQADRFLGAQEEHLDAIERVLRQRILGWRSTGRIPAELTGWEMATGKVKNRSELYALYRKPEDRDFWRDHEEGQLQTGTSPPEGLVYFPEVLAFYLEHRPASRLLDSPRPDEPLGKVLARVAQDSPAAGWHSGQEGGGAPEPTPGE